MYCNNNPIMYVDENGNIAGWLIGAIIIAAAIVVNHIVSAIEYGVASSKVNDKYTKEEADAAIEEITGKDSVSITKNEVFIQNSEKIKSRYDRILISKIITNTVDENDNYITNRTTYGLAAEWCGHNTLAHLNIMYENTAHVNLDNEFKRNKWYTEIGTSILLALGFL